MIWVKNNALAISLLLILIGSVLIYQTNDYDISSKTISTVVDGKINSSNIYTLENKMPIISILSNTFLSLGLALFISAFFIRYIEGNERKELEAKLLKFQEDTAKNAIHSVFKKIIDEDFFSIIKKDLLNAKSIRKNANWQYDISDIGDGKLNLKRTISYEFHNISTNPVSEYLKLKSNNNKHCSTKVVSGKVRHLSGNEETIELTSSSENDEIFTSLEKEINIPAGESIEVVLVFEQVFKNGYIYETHSSRHPIVDLEITVNFPLNYKFDLFSSFSNKERLRINEPDKKVYVIEGAIFRGQGVEFVCEKNPNK